MGKPKNDRAVGDSRPVPDDADETFIVGHDGKRVTVAEYSAPETDDTYIVGLDGKRVKRANYKDGK